MFANRANVKLITQDIGEFPDIHSVVMITTMLTGYIEEGSNKEAFKQLYTTLNWVAATKGVNESNIHYIQQVLTRLNEGDVTIGEVVKWLIDCVILHYKKVKEKKPVEEPEREAVDNLIDRLFENDAQASFTHKREEKAIIKQLTKDQKQRNNNQEEKKKETKEDNPE